MKLWRWLSKEEMEKRHEKIIELRGRGLLYKQIGKHFGITGERASQIERGK